MGKFATRQSERKNREIFGHVAKHTEKHHRRVHNARDQAMDTKKTNNALDEEHHEMDLYCSSTSRLTQT